MQQSLFYNKWNHYTNPWYSHLDLLLQDWIYINYPFENSHSIVFTARMQNWITLVSNHSKAILYTSRVFLRPYCCKNLETNFCKNSGISKRISLKLSSVCCYCPPFFIWTCTSDRWMLTLGVYCSVCIVLCMRWPIQWVTVPTDDVIIYYPRLYRAFIFHSFNILVHATYHPLL